MVTIPLLAALLIAQDQPLVSANAARPSICVSAQSGDAAPDTRGLSDSVRDIERALRSIERKHQFAVVPANTTCAVTLMVLRRVEDEEEETLRWPLGSRPRRAVAARTTRS